MTTWEWNGAKWWRFDFHTHTPASCDYGKGPDQQNLRRRSPREWLLDYMRAGIDCVAVTDHNSGDWVDKLKQALSELEEERPEGFRPLHLFPGVEISVNGGVDVLAIFGPEKTTADIDSLLGAVKFRGAKGATDSCTESSFVDVVLEVANRDGTPIPAHVDKANGLFSLPGKALKQALDCEPVTALEIVDPAAKKPGAYLAEGCKWAVVLGSDAHHPTGDAGQQHPGSHFTWVKMGNPSLEGLKLALLDGPMSVRRSDETAENPNGHAPLIIERVEVEHARYIGRSQPFLVSLNPWLSAIIGGRGTGKSTLVEFLRLALRRQHELPPALVSDFQKYAQTYHDRDEEGLLTESTSIAVTYRKDATRFRIQWSPGGELAPIEEEREPGHWKAAEGDVGQRFPVRIYSQKQIFELAKAPLALLRIVDDAGPVDRRSWEESWRETEARFLTLRTRAREIETSLAEEPRLKGELEDVKRKLEVFEQAGHADVLKRYQRRLRQRRTLDSWEESWADLDHRIRELADDAAPGALGGEAFDPDDDADKSLQELTSSVGTSLEEIASRLVGIAADVEQIRATWRESRSSSKWQKAFGETVRAYDDLRERLSAQDVRDPSVYGELVQRRQMLEERIDILQAQREERNELEARANSLLAELLKLRRELTVRRRHFIDDVLGDNPYVRIDVVPFGATETVESEFRRLIGRDDGAFERDVGCPEGDGLLGDLYVESPDADEFAERLAQLKAKVRDFARGEYEPTKVGDQRFPAYLGKLSPEAFDRLDCWFPEDSLAVRYSTPDGTDFRPIQEGSPGQKTAALLAFLLSYGEEPIVLDQPEDDLDNHLIYDLIVQQLRAIKVKRQVLVVTHNANIVVNGDAELIVALVARSGETHKESEGPLQERSVRDTICDVMEGGREAFEERYRRIVLER